LPVTTLLINKRIALMGMPGEPFVSFQTSWRDRCRGLRQRIFRLFPYHSRRDPGRLRGGQLQHLDRGRRRRADG
ncbi:MAG: hypothetical protein DMG26_05550, partial [Acidobacteria bacterium]